MRISRAVKEKSRLGRCGTTPIRRLTSACSFHTSCSPIHAWPEVGRTRVRRSVGRMPTAMQKRPVRKKVGFQKYIAAQRIDSVWRTGIDAKLNGKRKPRASRLPDATCWLLKIGHDPASSGNGAIAKLHWREVCRDSR